MLRRQQGAVQSSQYDSLQELLLGCKLRLRLIERAEFVCRHLLFEVELTELALPLSSSSRARKYP